MSEKSVNNNIEDLKSLSNDEIRERLEHEFRFDCGPITQSTRSVYLKKLFKLIDERHQTNQSNEELLQNNHQNNGNDFESPQELDNNSNGQSIRSSSRTPSNRNSPRRKLEEELTTFVTAKTSTPKTRRQSSNVSVSVNKKITPTPKSRKTLAVIRDTSSEHLSGPPFVPSLGLQANSHSSSLTNYSSESSENEDKIDDNLLSKIRKSPRKKLSTPPTPRPLQDQLSTSQRVPFARPYPPSTLTPMTNASKLSNFSSLTRPPLRRAPLVSGQPSAKLANYSDSEDTEQEQNNEFIRERLLRHRPGLNISSLSVSKPPQSATQAVGFEDTNNFSSTSNFISFAILVIVVLFFVFIFSFYFYTRISSSPKSAVDLTNFDFIGEKLVAPVCQSNTETTFGSDSDNCLKYQSDIMPALTVAKEIKTFIDRSILKYYCSSTQQISSFNDLKEFDISDIKTAIRDHIKVTTKDREGIEFEGEKVVFDRDLANALTLIHLNPNCQLKCISDSIGEITAIAISDDYPLNLPFSCHALLTLKLNYLKIFTAFVLIFVTFGSILYYKRSKKIATEEQDLVYDLVEKSLELLQSPDNPQSMPVLHIRDTLLSPSERKTSKYKRIWYKVVKHIESTESRVKVDIENIEGEDFKAWKWVAINTGNNDVLNSPASTTIRTGGIEWQGQAFNNDHNLNASQIVANTNNGGPAVKSCFSAPTPFLKIRNMFDEETKLLNPNEWKHKIQTAILEKISIASKNGSHGVVHLEVEEDSNEGLVYLKCNSIETATEAFNALHGWWCEKKLVSVKFLKSERYYQRFPASVHNSTLLTSQ